MIRVENLGKRYRIGAQQMRYSTLRDLIVGKIRNISLGNRRKPVGEDTIWALRDVSFEVSRGEVVGIIGRNGAGKSTLLKILSHITEPTKGRVCLRGGVGSLLEVGTGFHLELTGRENIYLNGAILGMKKAEIERKFDEIVAFAEIEKFLDTPVKRYSSGMYVRLAFSVAAHLEPEILLVDEVLAVGDAAFQKKSLGKMGDAAREGHTVLFVSHNMQAVSALCARGLLLSQGNLVMDADMLPVVRNYLASGMPSGGSVEWLEAEGCPGDETVQLRAIRLVNGSGKVTASFQSSEPITVQLDLTITRLDRALVIGFDLGTPEGVTVMRCYHNDGGEESWPKLGAGYNRLECKIPSGLLNAGTFTISPRISLHCVKWIVSMDAAITFNVELTHGRSPFWNVLDGKTRPGVISPIIPWRWTTAKDLPAYTHTDSPDVARKSSSAPNGTGARR